jgi:hypothetical protein
MTESNAVTEWPSMAISLQCSSVDTSSLMRSPDQLPSRIGTVSAVREESDQSSCGLVRGGGPVQAYNEEAFRYFLEIERKRSEISSRPFLLLLVDLKQLETKKPTPPALAGKLFSALWLCLRETDFIGWYREERVAGAVLTQRAEIGGTDISSQVRERVTRVMSEQLPRAIADRLQIRVYQLSSRPEGRS